ncbi:hypothetical protein Sros01_68280 [Streptomyces roseochromogenus]|nr:hypothetical protein Sros01_68280 [Streptomyces roseochromogenus]
MRATGIRRGVEGARDQMTQPVQGPEHLAARRFGSRGQDAVQVLPTRSGPRGQRVPGGLADRPQRVAAPRALQQQTAGVVVIGSRDDQAGPGADRLGGTASGAEDPGTRIVGHQMNTPIGFRSSSRVGRLTQPSSTGTS